MIIQLIIIPSMYELTPSLGWKTLLLKLFSITVTRTRDESADTSRGLLVFVSSRWGLSLAAGDLGLYVWKWQCPSEPTSLLLEMYRGYSLPQLEEFTAPVWRTTENSLHFCCIGQVVQELEVGQQGSGVLNVVSGTQQIQVYFPLPLWHWRKVKISGLWAKEVISPVQGNPVNASSLVLHSFRALCLCWVCQPR